MKMDEKRQERHGVYPHCFQTVAGDALESARPKVELYPIESFLVTRYAVHVINNQTMP